MPTLTWLQAGAEDAMSTQDSSSEQPVPAEPPAEAVGRRSLFRFAGAAATVGAAGVLVSCTAAPAPDKPAPASVPTAQASTTVELLAALEAGTSAIALTAGEFELDEPLILSPGTMLSGAGQATRLRATKKFDNDRPIIAIGDNSGPAEGVTLADFVVDCDNEAASGIAIEGIAAEGYQHEIDSMCRLDNLWVYDSLSDGIVYAGKDSRSIISSRLRVRRAGGHGMLIRNSDSWWIGCEATTMNQRGDTAGFFVDGGANNFFETCKAWYCRDYGWRVRGVRNKFIGCESQDTRLHGWQIEWDRNVFSACVADTAGMFDVGGVPNSADGFYFEGGTATSLVGCQSFDRQPFGSGIQQRHGFNVPADFAASGSLVAPTGYDNGGELVHRR